MTKKWIRREDGTVLICRPQLDGGTAVAVLRFNATSLPDSALELIRFLIVRKRSLANLPEATRRLVWRDEALLAAEVEFLRDEGFGMDRVGSPRSRGKLVPTARSVYYLLAVRRVPNPDKPQWPDRALKIWAAQENRPRIQINMGKWPRVWHSSCTDDKGRKGLSQRFNTREEANALKAQIEEGLYAAGDQT